MRTMELRCKQLIKNFIWDNSGAVILTKVMRSTHSILQNIQDKFLKQKDFKNSKIDVLLHYWEKLWKVIANRARKWKDTDMKELAKKIALVPFAVKKFLLTQYVNKCKELY